MNVWDRQPGESLAAWTAYETYRDMGANRTLEAVAKKLQKSLTIMGRWSSRWSWIDRCRYYDAHMAAIAQAAREKAERKQAELWAARRQALRERGWANAEALIKKAEQMLQFPLQVVEKPDGDRLTIIHPAKWDFSTVPRLLDTAEKLARLAAEMETERITIEVDWSKVPDDVLARYRAGELQLADVQRELQRTEA